MELLKSIYAAMLCIFDDINFFSIILFVLFVVPFLNAIFSLNW